MAGSQYRLVVRQGPIPGQIFELNKSEVTIGRDISNDFVINDAEVSRKHARLTLEGERYKIEDLSSTNGTYIDGQRLIGLHVLSVGEIIMFGDNVGVIFEGEPTMPDVTIPSTLELGRTPVAPIPIPVESHIRPTVLPTPEMAGSLAPQPPLSGPEQEQLEEAGKKPTNTWLLAGCGCLLVIIVLVIALVVFIDQPWVQGGGLYCKEPFVYFFRSFGYCP